MALLFLLAPESHAGAQFEFGCKGKEKTDSSALIQTALNTHRRVVIVDSCTITQPVRIGIGQSLEIPSGVILSARMPENQAAIEMLTAGYLHGNGDLLGDGGISRGYGVQIIGKQNRVELGAIRGFDIGVFLCSGCSGTTEGVAYNQVRLRGAVNNIQAVRLDAFSVGEFRGWVNENDVHIGHSAIASPAVNPDRWNTSYGIYMDTHTINIPNGNSFSGSFEMYRTGVRLVGQYNSFRGLRLELANPANSGGFSSVAKVILIESSFNKDLSCEQIGGRKTFYNAWFGEYGVFRLPPKSGEPPVPPSQLHERVLGSKCDPEAKGLSGYGVRGMSGVE